LAREWGCTVREAQQRCDSREFAEWIAFYKIHPFGEDMDDMRMARTCQTIAGAAGAKSKAKDFMFNFGPKEPQTREQGLAALGIPV